jgi:two-component system cell cycle sensor histidine kinase/response regulator CckA
MGSYGEQLNESELRREVDLLRERVVELERRLARYDESGTETRQMADLHVSLSEREELMLEAERIAQMGSWIWNLESNSVFWSDQLFRILGYDPRHDVASVEGFFAAVHPHDRDRVRAASERGVREGRSQRTDFRVVRRDGTVRRVSMDGALLFDARGTLRRIVGTVLDTTESHEAARRLAAANAELEEAQAFAHLGSWSMELPSRTLTWSREFFRILGVDENETPSSETFANLIHPEDRELFDTAHRRSLETGAPSTTDGRIVRADGTIRNVRIHAAGEHDAEGKVVVVRGTLLDVTDLSMLQARLAHAEKMETIGRLAGGIAHDFNNIMTVLLTGMDFVACPEEGILTSMRNAIDSARSLTGRLLALGRQSTLRMRPANPNQLVREAVFLVRRLLGEHVTLRLDLVADLPEVNLDPQLTEQALINLLINARDAMPAGGEVRLSTRAVLQDGKPFVEIAVRDSGKGVDPNLSDRIFEPFFTTKGEGRGSGLGLAMVQGAVEQQGGSIALDPGGDGACFRLLFPAYVSTSSPTLAETQPIVHRPPGLTILVVEDQTEVADFVRRLLEREGHTVLSAERPSLAIELFRAHLDVIDLIISDVVMPEMLGPALVERLRSLGPLPPVLFVSGYGAGALHDLDPGHQVLSKPFSRDELVAAIERACTFGQSAELRH